MLLRMAYKAIVIPYAQCAQQTRISANSRPFAAPARSSSYLGSRLALRRQTLATRRLRARPGSLQPVRASIFGVGVPEAIMVGVVSLLVFGPKGLAHAAKGLGQTFRALQPTIKELRKVGMVLKGTLEQEIGIDEIRSEFGGRPVASVVPPLWPPSSAAAPPAAQFAEMASRWPAGGSSGGDAAAAVSEEQPPAPGQLAADMETGICSGRQQEALAINPEMQRKQIESAAMTWDSASPAAVTTTLAKAATVASVQQRPKAVDEMSTEELETELARRRMASVLGAHLPRQL